MEVAGAAGLSNKDPVIWELQSVLRILLLSSDLQDANKKYFFLSLFAYYFLKVHHHPSSAIKSHREITTPVEIKVFLTLLA
jgi:hypothetical protein